MKKSDFIAASIESAHIYYAYLEQNDKGKVECPVRSIKLHEKKDGLALYKLEFPKDKRIPPNTDGMEFVIKGMRYTQKELRIALVVDGVALLVQPVAENLQSIFGELKAEDILLISDLKFLVKNVENWYKEYGNRISIPQCVKFPPYKKHENTRETPTDEQCRALAMMFTRPISYVWGAPGTGKTRCVLAHALLHCIRESHVDGKIVVTAPTNNAVDQTLLGVLSVFAECGESELNIFRLGTPTAALYREYPQICEYGGTAEKISALKAEAYEIEKALEQRAAESAVRERILRQHQVFNEFESALLHYCESLHIKELLAAKEREQAELEKRRKHHVSLCISAKKKYDDFCARRHTILERLLPKKKAANDIRAAILLEQAECCAREAEECCRLLNEKCSEIAALRNTVAAEKLPEQKQALLDFKHREGCPRQLTAAIVGVQYDESSALLHCRIDDAILEAFPPETVYEVSTETLKYRLAECKSQIHVMETCHSTFDSARIIAGTLDTIIGKYDSFLKRSGGNVSHVFIDEAAYAPLAKGIVAFSFGAPVTFLGDHKQIPPVCEMDEYALSAENQSVVLWAQSVVHCEEIFRSSIPLILENAQSRKPPVLPEGCMTALNYTHRFGQNLAAVLAQYVYTGDFHGAPNADVKIKVLKCSPKPKDIKDKMNPCEANEISKCLKENNFEDAAILTPYKEQVKLLQKTVPFAYRGNVMAIHASQGREYDTVILSVRDRMPWWFTDSNNLKSNGRAVLNTALSRAKKQLIIACDEESWKAFDGQLLAEIIRHAN